MPPNSSDEFEVNERKMFALCMRNDYFVTCLSAAKHSEIIVASFASGGRSCLLKEQSREQAWRVPRLTAKHHNVQEALH